MFDWLGSLFSGGAQIASTAMQNQQSAANQQAANIFNAQQADIGRHFATDTLYQQQQYNSAEAAHARQFASQQQDKSAAFNAAEAQKARDFNLNLSSTAFQRAKSDMTAAGLNPILAYRTGGAGTPAGASASVGATSGPAASSGGGGAPNAAAAHAAPVASLFSPGVAASAMEMMRLMPQVDNLKAQADNTKQQTQVAHQDEIKRNQEAKNEAARYDVIKQEAQLLKERTENERRSQAQVRGPLGIGFNPAYTGEKMKNIFDAVHGMFKGNSPDSTTSAKSLQQMYNGGQ